jgi:hypothetical protein
VEDLHQNFALGGFLHLGFELLETLAHWIVWRENRAKAKRRGSESWKADAEAHCDSEKKSHHPDA